MIWLLVPGVLLLIALAPFLRERMRKPMNAAARLDAPGVFRAALRRAHPLPLERPPARPGCGLRARPHHALLCLERGGQRPGCSRVPGADI